MRLIEDSFDDTEQVQAIVRSDFCLLSAIWQSFGIAASDARARIGQLLPAQQATEAQQDFAVFGKASDNMFGVSQSMTAAIRNQAFVCRDMVASYHGV